MCLTSYAVNPPTTHKSLVGSNQHGEVSGKGGEDTAKAVHSCIRISSKGRRAGELRKVKWTKGPPGAYQRPPDRATLVPSPATTVASRSSRQQRRELELGSSATPAAVSNLIAVRLRQDDCSAPLRFLLLRKGLYIGLPIGHADRQWLA
jgi:hypothetical protein